MTAAGRLSQAWSDENSCYFGLAYCRRRGACHCATRPSDAPARPSRRRGLPWVCLGAAWCPTPISRSIRLPSASHQPDWHHLRLPTSSRYLRPDLLIVTSSEWVRSRLIHRRAAGPQRMTVLSRIGTIGKQIEHANSTSWNTVAAQLSSATAFSG